MMLQLPEVLTTLTPWSVALRILLALLIGGCIGSERGRHGRAAGLRTHILVCLGSTMTTLIGLYSTNMLGSVGDPMRIGAQVVSGISFLGVGTIMVRNRSHVTGLTTAAGLWATACIGLGVGAGFYWAALLATIAVLLMMQIGYLFGANFDQAMLLGNSLNLARSEIIEVFVYNLGLNQGRYSLAAAAGLFQSVISLILVIAANNISRKLSGASLF